MNEYEDDIQNIELFPKGKVFRFIYDAATDRLRILAKTQTLFDELREAFTYENKAAFFSQQHGYRGTPYKYSVNGFGFFEPGLLWNVIEWIKTQYGSGNVVAISQNCAKYIKDFLTPLSQYKNNRFELSEMAEESGRNDKIRAQIEKFEEQGLSEEEIKKLTPPIISMREYQRKGVEALLFDGCGRGMVEIPTAGGKSYLTALLFWNYSKHIKPDAKFIVLVPNVQLVAQLKKDFVDYGYGEEEVAMACGGMSAKEKKANDISRARITVVNTQYLRGHMDELPKYDVLFVDECHTAKADKTVELIRGVKTKIRVACSGTIIEDKYQRDLLVGLFGRVVYRERVTDLQNSGFISKLRIRTMRIFDKDVDADRNILFNLNTTRKYKQPTDYMPEDGLQFDDAVNAEREYFSKYYAELYKPVLDHVSKLEGNTLVLFDKIAVGEGIFNTFKELYPSISSFYTDGKTDVGLREEIRSGLEKSDGNVLFANVQIMSTGINVKRLHNLVFCFGSKSMVRVIQSCGRILRLYDGKDCATLVDTVFNFKYSDRHYKERLKLYKQFYGKNGPDETIDVQI